MSGAAVKAGYKRTEVGVIPEEWTVEPLKQLSPKQSVGIVVNPSSYFDNNGTVPMLVGSNVAENGIHWETAKLISDKSNRLLSSYRLRAGDLVMVRVGEPGVTAVVPRELDDCSCASMMIVRQHSSFDSKWLCYVMNSRTGRYQVEQVQYGTAQKQFNISDAVNFKYAVPPILEQRAISAALSDMDALINGLDQLIAKKRDLKQAAMQQLLTGQRRLPGFSGAWETKQLGEIATLIRDHVVPAASANQYFTHFSLPAFDDGKMPVREMGDQIKSIKFRVQKESVLVSKLNPRIPRIWAPSDVPEGSIASTEFLVLQPKEGTVRSFLYVICSSKYFCGQMELSATGTTGSHQRISPLGALKISFPMPLNPEEQSAIATVLSDMDAELAVLESRRDKTRDLKQGMMQELLTGRIRLV